MNQRKQATAIVYTILFIVYNIVFFCIPFPKTIAAYIELLFTWAAFGISYLIYRNAFDDAQSLQSKVYGFPIFRLGYLYLAVQCILGFLVGLIGYVVDVPIWVVIMLSVLILGAALIGAIAADQVRNTIEQTEQQSAQQTKTMTYFRLDVSELSDKAGSTELKEQMRKLEEEAKYSDPVSGDSLKEIEQQLQGELSVLQTLMEKDEQKAVQKVAEIRRLLAARNRKCMAEK